MVERKRIGFRFSYNEDWIAGSYYILNIIHALNTLEDNIKPNIIIISENIDNFNIVKKETNYPFLEYFIFPFLKPNYNLLERAINKINRIIFSKNIILKKPKQPNIDFLYPNQIDVIKNEKLKKVNWIPDFQEEHLPRFFSEQEIQKRKKYQRDVICNGDVVVFSSKDAQSDFNKLYANTIAKQYVLNFAVTLPNFENQNINVLLKKYNLSVRYFFSPNQFWAHKNHIIVLKAVKLLKEKGINVLVAFSGKENDFRNLENFNLLKEYITKNELEDNIKFLGFIDRREQLCLLNNAIAVVQPSLFEGWSTVVEDSKALNKFIILSNLNVHKEQITDNVHFFDPLNHKELSEILDKYYKESPKPIKLNYKDDIYKFANRVMDLIDLTAR